MNAHRISSLFARRVALTTGAAAILGAAFSGCGGYSQLWDPEFVADASVPDSGTDATADTTKADSNPDSPAADVTEDANACPGAVLCYGKCVDVKNDPANCGGCGKTCPTGQVCSLGGCALECQGGTELCGSLCIDLDNDPKNCGVCGKTCAAGEVCSQGACGTQCAGGSTNCNDKCVTTDSDPANCGACNHACNVAAGEWCVSGACKMQCVGGSTLCNGKCVDTTVDPANCGTCGTACPQGQVCSVGKCATSCTGGTTQCGELCVNTDSDPSNCGTCGKACGAEEVCSQGVCSFSCVGGSTACSTQCVDLQNDPAHCGTCSTVCNVAGGEVCSQGQCGMQCVGGSKLCNGKCVDTLYDPNNCGTCGTKCPTGQVCTQGACAVECLGGTIACAGKCIDVQYDPHNCGSCGHACAANETCASGACQVTGTCPQAHPTLCFGTDCVDTQTDTSNCGSCGNKCPATNTCVGGVCTACDSSTTDCDGDGWKVSDGDCCDTPGLCGSDPALVNPGAIEVVGNGSDDNCNGKVDLFDQEDTRPCDTALASNASDAGDYVKAIGICRTTQETAPLPQRTWGLISSQILRADGSALTYAGAKSIRGKYGDVIMPLEGQSMAVISTGIAADATQTDPGPNGGAPASNNVSTQQGGTSQVVQINQGGTYSVKDWFATANLPLKAANNLPNAPGCTGGSSTQNNRAYDSVMLVMRLRAPTNAKAFSFNAYFFSAEFPEYVCTSFNDQFVALINTPAGTPSPIPNPVDKNLMTYKDPQNQLWPIGINIAKGTDLFSVCNKADLSSSQCLQAGGQTGQPSANSCGLGAGDMPGTGFEKPTNSNCYIGGGTYWLTTAGNVIPGGIVEVRIAIWDVRDHEYDSLAVIDGFRWLATPTLPGTH